MQKGRLSAMSALVFSCKRTQSRLIEMTSKDYLEANLMTYPPFGNLSDGESVGSQLYIDNVELIYE